MHFVYPETNEPVPADIRVLEVPEGFSEAYPQGGFFTKTTPPVQVTGIKDDADGAGITNPQPPDPVMTALADIKSQLNRIESNTKPKPLSLPKKGKR